MCVSAASIDTLNTNNSSYQTPGAGSPVTIRLVCVSGLQNQSRNFVKSSVGAQNSLIILNNTNTNKIILYSPL